MLARKEALRNRDQIENMEADLFVEKDSSQIIVLFCFKGRSRIPLA